MFLFEDCMRKSCVFMTAIIFVLLMNSVHSAEFPKPYDVYINDYAKIFSEQETDYLRYLLDDIYQNTTAQVVIITVVNLSGYDISEYATKIGQEWGVGNKEKDNGLVILYAKQENKIFAATGYGLEGILPDSKIGRMLDENYVPYKESGNVTEGIIAFTEQINGILKENGGEIRAQSGSSSISVFNIVIFLLIVFFILALVSYPFVTRRQKGFGDFLTFFFIDFLVRTIIWSFLLRGGKGSSSSSGFGGGGFGGGGFGGGGAGR